MISLYVGYKVKSNKWTTRKPNENSQTQKTVWWLPEGKGIVRGKVGQIQGPAEVRPA